MARSHTPRRMTVWCLLFALAPLPFVNFHLLGFFGYLYWSVARPTALIVYLVGLGGFVLSFLPILDWVMGVTQREGSAAYRFGLPSPIPGTRTWYIYAWLVTGCWWVIAAVLWLHLQSRFGLSQLKSPSWRAMLAIYGLYVVLLVVFPLVLAYLNALSWLIRGLKAVAHNAARLGVVFALLVVLDLFFAVAIQLVSLQGLTSEPIAFSGAFALSTASMLLLESPTSDQSTIALLRSVESLLGAALLACLVALVLGAPVSESDAERSGPAA
jgi:hypothetical protein